MNAKTKKALAKKNGKINELYVQEVRKAVANEYKPADESAILRKAVAYLFTLIASLHEGEIDNAEFAEYHAKVEQLKSEIKTELGVEQGTT